MDGELGLDAQTLEWIAESHTNGTKLYMPAKAHDHVNGFPGHSYSNFDWYRAYLDSGEPVLVLRRNRT